MNHLAVLQASTIALFTATDGHAGFSTRRDDGFITSLSPSINPMLNYVFGTDTRHPETVIDQVLRTAEGRGLMWKVLPDDPQRERLATLLAEHGFLEVEASTPIWGPIPDEVEALTSVMPAGTTVKTAEDYTKWLIPFCAAFGLQPSDAAHLHAAAVARGFEDDVIQHVFIEHHGQPVAAGTLVRTDPTLAGVFNLAVHPDARRQGLGTAMLGALALRAHRAGHTELGQFSTAEGLPLYRHHGEETTAVIRNFVRMPIVRTHG